MASGSISALNERLRTVAGKGNWEEIEQLLRHGATFEADKYGRTALHYAAHYGHVKTIKVCITRGCQLDKVDTYGCTALHKAIAPAGHVEAVRALIDEGCDVDGQDENGNTCLHEGAWNGFSQSLDVLIKFGKANVHTINKNGQEAIHLACQKGHNQSTRILLKAGSHPNVKNSSGETPLHITCRYGHNTCARILISAECDVNMRNKEGNTPLHIAAGLGRQKIARMLLEAQCEAKIRNKSNQTALDLARQNDQRDVALLISGAHRMKKGKRSFFSRNKRKDSNKLDDFGNASHHHHHHSDSSPNDKHKRRHSGDRRGDDDLDGGQGGLRIRGRREMEGTDRHSSGSSKGKSKSKRDKRRDDGTSQGQNLFVREELTKQKRLQEQIHLGREMGNSPHVHEHQGNPHFRTQLFKDKTGKMLHVPMPVQCNCTPYIKKLENQVEASKERLLHEIDMSKARFESRMNNIEKRMGHQAQCMDQLCKERIAAERADCIHRIDKRAKEERKAWSEEHDARTDVLRNELRHWFESRIQPLHEQLSRTMDDAAIATESSTRRSRPRAGFYRLNGREVVTHRKRSKSVGNVSDCDLEEEDDDDDSDEESEDESEDGEEVDEERKGRKNSRVEEHPVSSRQPSEQSPHHYKKVDTAKAKDYAKSGAIPKSSRSGSFRLAVSDEERASGSSSNSGTPLSMVDGTYRPPLIAAHERSPAAESNTSIPNDFVFPSEETDDTESSETSESETASQQSLETVSYKPKSDISSSTRDSGLHTLKGSSVSSDRRSHGPTRADMIAYQALTVNARPPPPLQAQVRARHPGSSQPPPSDLRMQSNYTPPFSPPVSPTSTASQPLSTSTLASSTDGQRVMTPSTEHPSSDNPSPTDSGKAQSTSSGISSGEATSIPNSSPIKYNIISPHGGQSYQRTYNPRPSSYSSQQPEHFKVVRSENVKTSHDEAPPPYRSSNGAPSEGRNRVPQPYLRNSNNANSNQSSHPPRNGTVSGGTKPYQSRIGSGSDTSTGGQTQGKGYSAAPARSAASRLGVTPSLNAVRDATVNQGVSGTSNTNSTSGKGTYQMHQQPRSQPSQSLPPGYSVVQGRSGSNGAMFAITRTNQYHDGTLSQPGAPANKNNNAAPNSSSMASSQPSTFPTSSSRTINGHPRSGNHYNVPNGASTTNRGTFSAPHDNFYWAGGKNDSTDDSRTTSSSYNRGGAESSASNGTLSSNPRNSASVSNANKGLSATRSTGDKRTSGISSFSNSDSGNSSRNADRRSGPAFVSNGASGANLISTVESFNRTAAPEQKLKYTREIIL